MPAHQAPFGVEELGQSRKTANGLLDFIGILADRIGLALTVGVFGGLLLSYAAFSGARFAGAMRRRRSTVAADR